MFAAEIIHQDDVNPGYTRLSYMGIRGKYTYMWDDKPDIVITLNEDIILREVELILANNRGQLKLKNDDINKITAWMVGFYLIVFSTLSTPHKLFFFFNLSRYSIKSFFSAPPPSSEIVNMIVVYLNFFYKYAVIKFDCFSSPFSASPKKIFHFRPFFIPIFHE